MRTDRIGALCALAGLAFAAAGAAAETFACRQLNGAISYQQWACEAPLSDSVPLPAARAGSPAAARPASSPIAGAPAPARPAASPTASTASEQLSRPPALTRRQREVLELTTILQRCRADDPAFAERSSAVHAAWQRRHAPTLAQHGQLLAARLRDARRGAATVPLHLCTDDWLRKLEPLARMPDARFESVEKTWSVFVEALKAADRETLLNCLTGKAEQRWRQHVEHLSDADLRRMGAALRAFKVQWGDDYLKEALAARDDNRIGGLTFQNLNEEWKISEL